MKRAAVTFGVLAVLMMTTVQASAAPSPKALRCAGTYLVVENLGAWSLWTSSSDGTAQVTSSAEDAVPFSHQQGAWKRLTSGAVKVTTLDFPVDGQTNPSQVARVDAEISFTDACASATGSLELRYYSVPVQDPLDPDDGSFILSEVFTGRLVTPN